VVLNSEPGGALRIKYRDLDQLDGVLRKLDRKWFVLASLSLTRQ
jgi:hypothetical protein